MTQLSTKTWPELALQWGRDLVIAEIELPVTGAAAGKVLQWGRDLVIAEIRVALTLGGAYLMLQWGRDLVIAEIIL